jgi:hypothetical protein
VTRKLVPRVERDIAPGWPERIEAAQRIREYTIAGEVYSRIRYGDEKDRWPDDPCHDCAASKGQYHVEFICDTEECPRCHGQVIGCDCSYAGDAPEET